MRTISDVLAAVPTSAENGLSAAAVVESRQKFGANRLTPLPREPLWKKFLEKFDEPIIKILLAAALLSIVVDLFKHNVTQGGVAFGLVVVVLVAGFVVPLLRQWVPSLMFGCALTLVGVTVAVGHPSFEGLAVMIAVVLATGVAFASEYKSDREFEVLNAQKDSIRVKVVRDGSVHSVPLEEVVVGDSVVLEMGDEVPADGRLLRAVELHIDQSLLTGESEPVRKQARPAAELAHGPDQPGCLYRGTQVVDGTGQIVVCEVGDTTMIGQIAAKLSSDEPDEEAGDNPEARIQKKLTVSKELTPLQLKLVHLANLISYAGYIAAIAIFAALIAQDLIYGKIRLPVPGEDAAAVWLGNASEVLNAVVYMVIIIVVAVPEGLPMSVTVSLALAMQKMTRANSLVRQLVACETIGSATVICSDKTGTLTQNKMQVERVVFGGKAFNRGSPDWPRPDLKEINHPQDWLALNGAVNSTANLEEKEGKLVTVGNSTEGSLLNWLKESGHDYAKIRLTHPTRYQIHFSSERKRMTTVCVVGDRLAVLVKGAPEWVLEQATRYQGLDGKPHDLTDSDRQQIRDQLASASGQAMRTLAFAYALLPAGTVADEDALHGMKDELEKGLVFIGFVAIRDPLREDVKEAVDRCRAAGIEVKMITGDNVETARAIARDIGMLDRPDSLVLTSQEFNKLTDDEVKERLPKLRVLARARPLDKFRMVKLLQEQDQVVAMTGDGTNDAPSLKKADVGLAMGIAGTEVAKEASKIVLLDDSFATIVKAVHWGRSLYENIQRFIQFQLTINVSALLIAFLGPFIGVRPPFTVLQLLWINVIMDTFAAIALCSEPPRPGLMRNAPKRKDESIVSPVMWMNIGVTAAFFVVVMLTLLWFMKGDPRPGHAGLFAAPPNAVASEKEWLVEANGKLEGVPAERLKHDGKEWRVLPANATPDAVGDPATVNFTVYQVSIFFTVYVFFQVWNQINCRSLTPEVSGFAGLFKNPTFLMIASFIVIGQALIVTFGGSVFKVEPLGATEWAWIALGTASVLVFVELSRLVRRASA